MLAGEVVCLKSGSPEMTLDVIDGEYGWCSWFSGTARQQAKFRLTSLKKYSAPMPVSIDRDYNPYM